MTRFGMILFCALAAPAVAAAAENLIEPGQWKVTSNTAVNGAVPASRGDAVRDRKSCCDF